MCANRCVSCMHVHAIKRPWDTINRTAIHMQYTLPYTRPRCSMASAAEAY